MEIIWTWHPPVGVWIGVLGLLGVLVPLIRDIDKIGKREKALWTLAVFILLLLEIKSVYQDRNEHDREQATTRAAEERNFKAIADEITSSMRQSDFNFAQTMNRSDRIIAGVADSIKMQTGGDSFAFITLTGPESPILEVSGIPHPPAPWMMVAITSHGKYPLRNVHAILMDDERRIAAMQEYNKNPVGDWIKAIQSGDTEYLSPYLRPQTAEAPSGDVQIIGAYPVPQGTSKRLSIAFSSLNGNWNEGLHLGLVKGQWHQCLSVLGPKEFTKPFIWCDSDWPEGKALAEKDWAGIKFK